MAMTPMQKIAGPTEYHVRALSACDIFFITFHVWLRLTTTIKPT